MARRKEFSREITCGAREREDTSIMVKSIIMNEVDSVEGWVVAKDSMEAVLWMAWTIIQAEGIWKEISTKGEVQDIILNNIKVQREKQLAEMVMKRRKERALKLTEAAKRG